jgi:hypothetical protein
MLGQKKRNPDPPAKTEGGAKSGEVMTPPVMPPLRTFIVRKQGYSWNFKAEVWVETTSVMSNGVDRPRVVEAHGLGIDEARMISFEIFFFVDGDPAKPAHAPKLVLNSDAWDEVEEINAAFPVSVKH